MSICKTTTAKCKYCGSEIDEFYSPGYCSKGCYYSYKGEKALKTLQFDHTICGTCGRVRAEVETPPADYIDPDRSIDGNFAITEQGLEYISFGQEITDKAIIGYRYPTESEHEGSCRCGTISKSDAYDPLRGIETSKVLANILQRLREKEREGSINSRPDKDRLLRGYKQSGDFAYAVGMSLHGSKKHG